MSFNTIKSLYKKEILDIFRDKKTIIVMLVIPLLLYPAIFLFAAQISTSVIQDAQEKTYEVVLDFDEGKEEIKAIMNDEDDDYEYSFSIIDNVDDCETALENKTIDAYIRTDKKDGKTLYGIFYISSVTDSLTVSSMLEEILLEYRNQIRHETIETAGMDAESVLYPIDVEYMDTASSEQSVGYMLGSIIPLMLVVIIVMSATYPATDITAGEKERGTLETVLTLPVTSQEIFVSKFMAVSTIAVFSAFINIISMGIVTGFMYTSVMASSSEVSVDIASFIPAFIIVFLCVVIFALFMSALTMGICSMAKSFKEAQNYMTPFTLVIMFIGYATIIPSIELTITTSIIPVLNICLMIKQILTFEYNITAIFLVFISNILYAMISIILLGKMYNSENIMFSESGSDIKLFERRANIKAGGTPEISDAVIILLVSVIAMFFISMSVAPKNVLLAVAAPQIFFAIICIGTALYLKYDIKKTFSLKKPSFTNIISAVLMGAGMICLNLVASSVFSMFMKESTETLNDSMNTLAEGHGFITMLLIVGILPAICEEILFRGYLYSSLKEKIKPLYVMILVSAVFGIYHMNLIQSTVTAIIGMLLVLALYKTDCIFIPMIMHCLNNSFSVVCMYYPENSIIKGIQSIDSTTGFIIFVLFGVVFYAVGLYLTKIGGRKLKG